MTRSLFLAMIAVAAIASCKVTEKDMVGVYKLDGYPKTLVKINMNRTFEFSRNNRNPYLHPFDHPAEYFFYTKGAWMPVDKKTISLTSQSDTLIYPLASLQEYPPEDANRSHFTFYDTYGDTVKILYVQFPDSSVSMALHRSMDYFTEDLTKRDTLEFHFYGYRPYTFINGKRSNHDYKITLKPAFQPNFFNGTKFIVKRHRLIDAKRKIRFRLVKKAPHPNAIF